MIRFLKGLFCWHREVKFAGTARILGKGIFVMRCAKCERPFIYFETK